MKEKRLKLMELCFERAIVSGAKYIGVEIMMNDLIMPEIIINPAENIKAKLEYYKKAYNDDLILKTCSSIRISDFTYGNSLEEIKGRLTRAVSE